MQINAKSASEMSRSELESNIRQLDQLSALLKLELAARPPNDVPFYGFRDKQGNLLGFDTFRQALDAIEKIFPEDAPLGVLGYRIGTYYKTAEEVQKLSNKTPQSEHYCKYTNEDGTSSSSCVECGAIDHGF